MEMLTGVNHKNKRWSNQCCCLFIYHSCCSVGSRGGSRADGRWRWIYTGGKSTTSGGTGSRPRPTTGTFIPAPPPPNNRYVHSSPAPILSSELGLICNRYEYISISHIHYFMLICVGCRDRRRSPVSSS